MVIIIQDSPCGRKGVNTAIFTRQMCMDSKVVRADFGRGLIRPGLKCAWTQKWFVQILAAD